MFEKLLFLMLFFLFCWNATAAPISEITSIVGHAYYDGELLNGKTKQLLKVGGVIHTRGETSYAEGFFQNFAFRLLNGKMSIEKSLVKKGKRPQESATAKAGFKLLEGKIFFQVNQSFNDSALQLRTALCNFLIKSIEARPTTSFYASVSKDKVAIYVHKGLVNVIIPKKKKEKIRLTEGNFWEYNGSNFTEAETVADERLFKKIIPVFEEINKITIGRLGQ